MKARYSSHSVHVSPRANHPLTPFVDKLAVPPRRIVSEPTRLVIRLETATHRFHRELPPSRVWTFDGSLPGPTIEVDRSVALEVQWKNHLSGPLPVIVTVAPEYEVDVFPRSALRAAAAARPTRRRPHCRASRSSTSTAL